MAQMTGLNYKIQEMAHRIRELREIENFTIAEMAMKTGVSEQEYIDCEMGRSDLNFAFLYRCANYFKSHSEGDQLIPIQLRPGVLW